MTQLNFVCLIGTCGSSLASVNFNRFTLATNLAYRDKEGNAVIETTWHNVVADKTLEHPQKGDKVVVLGRLRNTQYEIKRGEWRYSTEIVATSVTLVSASESLEMQSM